MGQLTDGLESERRGWAWTMAQAKAAGNGAAVADTGGDRPLWRAGTAAVGGRDPDAAQMAQPFRRRGVAAAGRGFRGRGLPPCARIFRCRRA
ncbi:hypothetical protein AB5I41_25415 [Sphingomonas sp. MMS24-JH45]